jgi:hypothetical protein
VSDELQRTWEKTGVESFLVLSLPPPSPSLPTIFSQGKKNNKGTLRVVGF